MQRLNQPAAEAMPPPPPSDTEWGAAAWKGLELPSTSEPEFTVDPVVADPGDDLDMTPMVDVTFLLLIFFMVTASFVTQRAIDQPKHASDDQTSIKNARDIPPPLAVEVTIDQNNVFHVAAGEIEDLRSLGGPEFREQLRQAKDSMQARTLVVTAHDECWHKSAVRAWDCGKSLGFDEVVCRNTSRDY